jgi:hypothetical protein
VPTRPSSPPVAIRASTHWISTDSRKKPVAKMPLPKVSLASAPFLVLDVVARTKAVTQAAKTYSETA